MLNQVQELDSYTYNHKKLQQKPTLSIKDIVHLEQPSVGLVLQWVVVAVVLVAVGLVACLTKVQNCWQDKEKSWQKS
jgi:hypothetical protein